MRVNKLLLILVSVVFLFGCDTLKKTSNTTGGVFSLNGQWELSSSTPENTLVGTRVTVTPFIAEGRITALANNTQCFQENDLKWKNIATNNNGGFLLSNLLRSCSSATSDYQPAVLTVVNTNEVRLTGRNINGQDNTQIWRRVTR